MIRRHPSSTRTYPLFPYPTRVRSDLLKVLPQADEEAAQDALLRQGQLTKPAGSLGRLEELAVWLATWQGRNPPSIDRPYTAVFAGNHGIAHKGVSAYPAEVTAQMVQNFIDCGAAVNQLCRLANADLRVYEDRKSTRLNSRP